MCVWDGCPQQPESEREQQHAWETEGDLAWLPDPNEWIEPAEGENPRYDLHKRDAEDDGA